MNLRGLSAVWMVSTLSDQTVTITFDHAEGDLVAVGSGAVEGFAVVGKDFWKSATAKIVGNTVVLQRRA